MQQEPKVDEDDITQQLLQETKSAKQMFNQQESAKNDKPEKNQQIKKQRDQKFIDLMDDLDIWSENYNPSSILTEINQEFLKIVNSIFK